MHLLPAPGGVAAPPSSATSQDSMTPDGRSRPWGSSAASSAGHSSLPSFDPAVLPEVAKEAPAGGQAGPQPPGSLGPFNLFGAGPAVDPAGGQQLCWAAFSVCRLHHSSSVMCSLSPFTCRYSQRCLLGLWPRAESLTDASASFMTPSLSGALTGSSASFYLPRTI